MVLCEKFESRLGRIDFLAFESLIKEKNSEISIYHYIEEIQGPVGLMIFNVIDHGALF